MSPERKYGFCILCDKQIMDYGLLFCTKCREKDIFIKLKRFKELGLYKKDGIKMRVKNTDNKKKFYSNMFRHYGGDL